jgi:peroxiredoxin
MTVRQQWMVVAGIVALLAGVGFIGTRLLSDELAQVAVGSKAPPFTAVTLDSVPVSRALADYSGSVVLLNIWATWCEPCRVEMPSIEAVHRELASRGLKVVAVSIDQPGKAQAIRDFVAEYGLTFDVLHDSTGGIQTVYRTTGVPETFVLSRDGTIRKKWIGPEDWNSPSNKRLIERLLTEQE